LRARRAASPAKTGRVGAKVVGEPSRRPLDQRRHGDEAVIASLQVRARTRPGPILRLPHSHRIARNIARRRDEIRLGVIAGKRHWRNDEKAAQSLSDRAAFSSSIHQIWCGREDSNLHELPR
jgi:hypothetical protein